MIIFIIIEPFDHTYNFLINCLLIKMSDTFVRIQGVVWYLVYSDIKERKTATHYIRYGGTTEYLMKFLKQLFDYQNCWL